MVVAQLRTIMTYCGVTEPAKLAMRIGATESAVEDWIAGRALPSIPLMNRFAKLAGFSLTYLYHGKKDGLLPGIAKRLRTATGR
jgi:transcriptional regulator with XRE-family HTH domain